jgi:hypothetical protein
MRTNTAIDYIMVVALVMVSGNIIFLNRTSLFVVFIFATILFFYRKAKFDVSFVYFLVGLMVVFILQTFKFNFFPIFTFSGFYVRILIAYFLIKSIVDFPDKYVKVMYYISIMSFIFFVPVLLVPGLSDILIDKFLLYSKVADHITSRYSIVGLYNIVPGHEFRNAGPFWEMGAFGGYLILALMISYLRKPELKNKTNIILMIAILTTQSSTGYISFLLFLTYIFNREVKNVALKGMLIFSIIFVGYIAYSNLDFLGKKIEKQLDDARALMNTDDLEGTDTDRFVSILKDWHDIQGHVWVGRGPHDRTRFKSKYDTEDVEDIRTVGSTDILVRIGLPFFLWMFFLMYKSFSRYSRYHWGNGEYMGISIISVVLLLLTSETYFMYPLFWITMMLHYTIDENKNGTNTKKIKNKKKIEKKSKFYNLNS